ncbi:TDA10 family protein [Aspergillus candidus]|uniref:P-loop containing nucleoside triphosphate hydrolase protein n=1 Tax=Aspergillus candidus TaxID=41067 RepID=A0A2I2FIR5_ASPCN|nr:P-loop containing nucleoside triphosphate hydrolase protein [Aspergillus candidus]PLB40504.1 P-loop containing nucleoside triphosphate hydrolase protein [Aspergillus candidus]
MPEIIDDKSQHCIPFLLERLKAHQARFNHDPASTPPFFLGLNGVQGAGKTVLVSTLNSILRSPPYSLAVVTLSLDDLYLPHAAQQRLAQENPSNPLLQHRGQPGTHDLPLARSVFASLRAGAPTAIPQYDKSAFAGQGDRVPEARWTTVNGQGEPQVKVVIFEGWCVGFRAWDELVLREKWQDAVAERESAGSAYTGRLGAVAFEDVRAVDEALRGYDVITDQLDALIHIDAQDLHFVYDWRQQQELGLRATKGTGMTPEQVTHFVDGYYPSYELFTETLRQGAFKPIPHSTTAGAPATGWEGRQLRLVVDKDRRVQEVIRI